MGHIFHILLLCITLSFLLKVGFYRRWGILLTAALYALFTGMVGTWATGQSLTAWGTYLSSRPVLLNVSVCITLEASLIIGFCFENAIGAQKRTTWLKEWVNKGLYLYPGLLFCPVICYLFMQAFTWFPGVNFQTIIGIATCVTFLLVTVGTLLLSSILKGKSLRMEMLFMLNLLIMRISS